ncbi:tape measure protein, partial [Psychrobacter sp. 1Y4]|uniref:tape measure protein n=1 Tax=Psychrobacter sp. 1Y4 TaxID=3453575 RepID=UPI003F478205
KEMNLAQQDVLSVTKTINEAIQLSGGSAESNQAAITQLIQGLQSGVVRGEEFNSIMEQSPRLARAMADGLGVTLGQLRAMAAEGKLTSEVVITAVQSQGAAIQSEFDKMPLTAANSLSQLKNNFFSFIGDIDKQLNGSSGVASIIQQMATSLNEIDPATTDAVREAFTQLGEVAQLLGENVFTVTDNLGE